MTTTAVAQVIEAQHDELEARIRWLLNPLPVGSVLYEAAASPAPASLPPQGAASPDPQLLKFYAVSDYPSLVAAMLRHIEKLQSKLPKDGQPLLTRVRA